MSKKQRTIQVHLIRLKANSPHFQAIEKKSFLWLAHRPSRNLIFPQQKHSGLYAYSSSTGIYTYVLTVNCTVCLRIKYGYKAAQAVPTSPPVYQHQKEQTERRQSGTVGERERGRRSTGAGEGRERKRQASNLSPLLLPRFLIDSNPPKTKCEFFSSSPVPREIFFTGFCFVDGICFARRSVSLFAQVFCFVCGGCAVPDRLELSCQS